MASAFNDSPQPSPLRSRFLVDPDHDDDGSEPHFSDGDTASAKSIALSSPPPLTTRLNLPRRAPSVRACNHTPHSSARVLRNETRLGPTRAPPARTPTRTEMTEASLHGNMRKASLPSPALRPQCTRWRNLSPHRCPPHYPRPRHYLRPCLHPPPSHHVPPPLACDSRAIPRASRLSARNQLHTRRRRVPNLFSCSPPRDRSCSELHSSTSITW